MNNEVEKGNLRRCLDNCRQWADDIVIYDDGSTDDSVAVASEYTDHIILGETRDFTRELFHKDRLLQYALTLKPDWIFWIDADEILDREGTVGDLRKLAEEAPPEVEACSFFLVNLWRSETYYRTDGPFATEWFIRLWRVVPGMHIKAEVGLDRPSYPSHIKNPVRSSIRMLHYHFADYKKMLWGAGLGLKSKEELQEIVRKGHFILDERNLLCHLVPTEWFPPENVPKREWPTPKAVSLEEMKVYDELD